MESQQDSLTFGVWQYWFYNSSVRKYWKEWLAEWIDRGVCPVSLIKNVKVSYDTDTRVDKSVNQNRFSKQTSDI